MIIILKFDIRLIEKTVKSSRSRSFFTKRRTYNILKSLQKRTTTLSYHFSLFSENSESTSGNLCWIVSNLNSDPDLKLVEFPKVQIPEIIMDPDLVFDSSFESRVIFYYRSKRLKSIMKTISTIFLQSVKSSFERSDWRFWT